MTTDARIQDGVVVLSNGRRIALPLPIVQLLAAGEMIIARGRRQDRYCSGNIWGLDREGRAVWRVTDKKPLDAEFIDMELQGEQLIGFNFNGYRCSIDTRSGEVKWSEFTK
ncbi:MAG TPA: hypothetical protein VHB79_28790 [Polyangiaceae bacterium]|nr:hypothetical protein [Polyangiaceae bacterium]